MYELRAGKLVSGKLLLVSLVIVVFSGNTTGEKRGKSVTPVEGGGTSYMPGTVYLQKIHSKRNRLLIAPINASRRRTEERAELV